MNTKQQLQLVTFEQAKRLKESGFDWFVYHWYNSDGTLSNSTNPHDRNGGRCGLSAPSVAIALKWMRDVKGMHFGVSAGFYGSGFKCYYVSIYKISSRYDDVSGVHLNEHTSCGSYDSYELAEASILDKLLTLIEKEK